MTKCQPRDPRKGAARQVLGFVSCARRLSSPAHPATLL
jgi:hypothetical protein